MQALADADAALDRDTLSAIAWGNRADANGHLGNVEQALDDFDQALFIDSGYATAYLDRGLLFERLGRAAEAVEDFKRYLELAPNAADRAEIQAKIDALE
ncbi:MAG: tetratricopeptide repeat protein [Caldilineaceae bacterium]